MAEQKPFDFFLLRYVPNAVREEFVNIGLVMTESGGDGGGFAGVHFTGDWRRAKHLYPDIDLEMLDAIGRDIRQRILDVKERALLLHEFVDQYSNAIQVSTVYHVLAEDPVKEMKHLASSLVEMSWSTGSDESKEPRTVGRKWIYNRMATAFEAAGVWDFVSKDLPASPYTNELDDFTIDFGYVVRNELKLFHAVSLVDSHHEAIAFPLRAAKMKSRMPKVRTQIPKFTAVVEDKFDADNKDVMMVLSFMKDEEIRVARAGEMRAVAEQARIDLLG